MLLLFLLSFLLLSETAIMKIIIHWYTYTLYTKSLYNIHDTNKWYKKWKPVDSMEGSEPNLVNEQPLITKKNQEKKEKKRNTMKYNYYNLPFSK